MDREEVIPGGILGIHMGRISFSFDSNFLLTLGFLRSLRKFQILPNPLGVGEYGKNFMPQKNLTEKIHGRV